MNYGMFQLQESSIDDVLADDLGSLASEISLSKLETLSDFNLTVLSDQEWDRPQVS